MCKTDFKKGNIVYLRIIKGSDRWRYLSDDDKKHPERAIKEAKVITVGKKYITVLEVGKIMGEIKFDISNNFCQSSNYSAEYELYLTKQDAINQIEAEKMLQSIRDKILYSSILKIGGYEKIRAIYDILFK